MGIKFFIAKITLVFFIIGASTKLSASSEKMSIDAAENRVSNQREIITKPTFKGRRHSLINWSAVDESSWLDISLWKRDFYNREKDPHWKLTKIEESLRETVGMAIDCFGTCTRYDGKGESNVVYGSKFVEGDEVVTGDNSYMWVYMMEGTLLRLSPNSSVTFNEINIGEKENFLYVRIHWGNVLWLSRSKHTYDWEKIGNRKETDTLFLPMKMKNANPLITRVKNSDDLFSIISNKNFESKKYQRLNKLIKVNNKFVRQKQTFALLVMPNGTLYGSGMNVEMIVLQGGESFFKRRDEKQLGWKITDDFAFSKIEFYYRGFANRDIFKPYVGQWYRISPDGRLIEEYEDGRKFAMGEYITSNIPSILLARELLINERSKFAFYLMRRQVLAAEFGYRRWGSINDGGELGRHVKFLKEYTRRLETSSLGHAERFRKKLQDRGEQLPVITYDKRFYIYALEHYFRYTPPIY